ncbi:sulfate respiration complex hexadecaheme cytochrome HmcA [Thermodesulfobacterium hydrogeniphilum]|uniref:sulfate respiration complex hexadecaheme cytochrome HmcA n=1 Tax=Thermodesulfobacterium hydrogeniphilum TaxID=161156 RepID=UPI00056F8C00|nr:cytochrome c3 family protein [Thermodesulfobacterium hydrogeniphilum]
MQRKRVFILEIILVVIGISIIFYYSKGLSLVEKKNQISSQSEEVKNNEILIAHKEYFKKLEYAPVLFSHQKHVKALKEKGCKACHYINKKGLYVFTFVKGIYKKKSEEIKKEYHQKCIKCHVKFRKKGKKSGPIKLSCGECHKREYVNKEIKYPAFDFDFAYHDKHVKKLKDRTKNRSSKETCKLCHHTYDLKTKKLVYQNGTEESCYYCHDLSKKRGPDLSKIVAISKKENWNLPNAFHSLCLSCHFKLKKENKKAGPIVCSKCHTGKYKTIAELKKVPCPERGQKDKYFLFVKNLSKMKGVPFDHKFHENEVAKCRTCHHERLKACKDCHTIGGSSKGDYINLVTAYHSLFSDRSCRGCHYRQIKSNKNCLSCHYFFNLAEARSELADERSCKICHTGKKELLPTKKLSLEGLNLKKIKKEITIKKLSKEFEPAKMPHLKMINKLVEVSNNSKLATYFHRNLETICRGCHHKSNVKAELEKNKLPLCSNCHSVDFDPLHPERPRLQAAYHNQCIKCHENMQIKKAINCTDCHKYKKGNKLKKLFLKREEKNV